MGIVTGWRLWKAIGEVECRSCVIPRLNPQATSRVKSQVEASFPIIGPKLFNCLPKNIRNNDSSVDAFKARLDKFLKLLPDQPYMPGYQQPAPNNSIIEQLATLRAAGIHFNWKILLCSSSAPSSLPADCPASREIWRRNMARWLTSSTVSAEDGQDLI